MTLCESERHCVEIALDDAAFLVRIVHIRTSDFRELYLYGQCVPVCVCWSVVGERHWDVMDSLVECGVRTAEQPAINRPRARAKRHRHLLC